jgi:hypothetical protein
MGESKDDIGSEIAGRDSRAASPASQEDAGGAAGGGANAQGNLAAAVDPALRFADCPPTARSFIDVCLEPNADARTHSVEELLRHPWIETCGPKEEVRADVLRHLAARMPGTTVFSAAALPPDGMNVPADAGGGAELENVRMNGANLLARYTSVFNPDLPGALAGEWKLNEFIANGGEGQAYKMRKVVPGSRAADAMRNPICETTNETLVIKIYYGQDKETDFFERHMDLFKQGRYPGTNMDENVIRIHSFTKGTQYGGNSALFGGRSYATMECAENGDLFNFWRQQPMDQTAVCFIVREILHGLRVIHSTPDDGSIIAHRDLKTENVLVFANGEIKITDFGTAKGFGNRGEGAIMLAVLQGDPWLSRLALMVLQQCPDANDGGRMIEMLKVGGWRTNLPDPNTCVQILRQHAESIQGKKRPRTGGGWRNVTEFCPQGVVLMPPPPLHPIPSLSRPHLNLHTTHHPTPPARQRRWQWRRHWRCGCSWCWLRRRRPHNDEPRRRHNGLQPR